MGSLDIREHSSLETLIGAYMREMSPELARRASGRARVFAEPLVAGAARVAVWIREFAPELLDRPSLHIAVVSPLSAPPEFEAGSRTYQLLPRFLGMPDLPITISSVHGPEGGQRDEPVDGSYRVYGLPLHAYLENTTDSEVVDLLVLHDIAGELVGSDDWVEPLGHAIAAGTKVAAVAIDDDEQLLIEGLLGLYGFTVPGKPLRNPLAPRARGGEVVCQVGAGKVERTPLEGTLLEEVRQLFEFIKRYIQQEACFPPLQQYGVRVTGKDSPAKGGAPMLQLPEGLFFDPIAERFSGLSPDGLVSIHALDELGKNSALLASYEGRADRFHQLLWAIRVFFECAKVLPQLLPTADDVSEDEDSQVCPNCGGVHTAAERVDSMKEYLSEVFEGESPRTQVRAALELALDIVKRGGVVPDSRADAVDEFDDEDEEQSDLEMYESLLKSGYYFTAWSLVKETEDFALIEEGVEDTSGWTLPMLLVESSNWPLLELFLNGGGTAAACADDGGTLYHALACGAEPIPPDLLARLSEELREFDIDVDTPDESGVVPLEVGVMNQNWQAVAQLIDAGAAVSLTDLDVSAVAEALVENGFEAQAKMLKPKSRQKRARKQPATPSH